MSIADWPEELRPRERLLSRGPRSLSDAELLAVFLRTGIPGKSAVDLGRDLITRFGSLKALFASAVGEFSSLCGLGPAKYAQLQAAIELARRALEEELATGISLCSPEVVRHFLQLSLDNRGHETFGVLFLDVRNKLIAYEEIFRGTLTKTSVYPREVVKAAIRHNAAAVILAHNHPSGDPQPSDADHHLTKSLQAGLLLIDVKVHDHFIIAGHRWFSFSESGKL